jgi:1-acyl-sn-glycerol-3-phosphate acyltransferase
MWLLRRLNGVRFDIQGLEHIPRDRAVVVIPTHQSQWETFYLQLLISPHATILKRELLWVPFFGWGLALLKPIAIDRSVGSQALKTVLKVGLRRALGPSALAVLRVVEFGRVRAGRDGRAAVVAAARDGEAAPDRAMLGLMKSAVAGKMCSVTPRAPPAPMQ